MTNVTKRLLMVAAMCGLSSSPAGALLLCQDASTGEYTPDACDLILPIEPSQHAHECDATDWGMWFTKEQGADPVCSAYWDREMAVEMWLWHETERLPRYTSFERLKSARKLTDLVAPVRH